MQPNHSIIASHCEVHSVLCMVPLPQKLGTSIMPQHMRIFRERQDRTPVGGGHWAGIEDTLFEGFAQLLSFEQKMTCESVCKAWRSQLREPCPVNVVQRRVLDGSRQQLLDRTAYKLMSSSHG